MDGKTALGIVTTCLSLAGFIWYIHRLRRGVVKPHTYSWFIWGVITGIAFLGPITAGAGPGSWANAMTSIMSFVIFWMSFSYGTQDITAADKWLAAGAIATMIPWWVSDSPLLTVVSLAVIETLAFIPTIRKTLRHPDEEPLFTYALNTCRCALMLPAIETYIIMNWIYPVTMLVHNLAMVGLILTGRRLRSE